VKTKNNTLLLIGTDFYSILSPEEGFPEGTVVLTDVDFGDIENADSLGIGAFNLLDQSGILTVTPRPTSDDLIGQGQAESFI
jgi:hypothetical protein